MDLRDGHIIWMNGFENASQQRFSHASELADGTIQLTTANKFYHFTSDGKYLPGEAIILSSKGVDYNDAKPDEMAFISPGIQIFFANVPPKPVLFAVKDDSAIIWAHTFDQSVQDLKGFNGGKVLDRNIFLTGIYQSDNLSDGNKDERLTYFIKADASGKTLCTDTFDIAMRVEPIPALPNINHDWIYEGVLHPQFIQLYTEELEPVRLSDCYTQTCCRDTIIQSNAFICEGSDYRLPDGSVVKDTGNYVTAMNTIAGCDSIIHTHLGFKNIFNFSLGNDTCLTDNASIIFNVPADSSVQYRWQDGSNKFSYTAGLPGQYWVTATSYCNIISDSVKVFDECVPPVYVPSAFTPNKDGRNDIFRIANINSQHLVNFNVYNRYGQMIFGTDDAQKGWDGTCRNVPQPSGTYVYFIRYTDLENKPHMLRGTVVLIR
jgi:gliding motility-associated-like protein